LKWPSGAKDRFIVTQNNVTIDGYRIAEVTDEPAIVCVPKLSEDRWYIVQLGDYYDEIAHNIGGTKGQQPGVYAITGPDFRGELPGEMTQLKVRTRWAACGVRILVKSQTDLPAAVEAQKGFHLMPLSAYLRHGLAHKPTEEAMYALPPLPPEGAPAELREFESLGHWMRYGLPATTARSDALVGAFGKIGLSPARGFAWQSLSEPQQRGLARAAITGAQLVEAAWASTGEPSTRAASRRWRCSGTWRCTAPTCCSLRTTSAA
jgi:hypothetical protein